MMSLPCLCQPGLPDRQLSGYPPGARPMHPHGRFTCAGTHVGPWLGHPGTGLRFRDIPEVYFFTIRGERITAAWGLEDTWVRLQQLGLAGNQAQGQV